jgi:streptogramin lyase
VWVHYDYMVGAGYSDAPDPAWIQKVVDAFAGHGVTLHIDPEHTAIPAHKVLVPDWGQYAQAPGSDAAPCTGPDAVRFSDLKATYFHSSSDHPWHYAIFADYLFTPPGPDFVNCPSVPELGPFGVFSALGGYGQIGFSRFLSSEADGFGYNLAVSVGLIRDCPACYLGPGQAEAAIFMHELGHNLGLCHGGPNAEGFCEGDSGTEGKPNYVSIMNPDFEAIGIPYAATRGSTTIAGYRLDYSDTKLPDLNENNLDETVGLQDTAHPADISFADGINSYVPASGPIDWNQDGNTTDRGLQIDVNSDQQRNILHGGDDWAWLHARLAPPTVTGFSPGSRTTGFGLDITGVNLYGPATVIFAGGVSATATDFNDYSDGMLPGTRLEVQVPAGARSGRLTVVTAEGTATSSQSLTILTTWHDPQAIAAGPDGNLWFTMEEGNGVGSITPTGKISQFPIPVSYSVPGAITAGPDGNLWLADAEGNQIVRITPSGTVSDFVLPTPSSFPLAITVGPDGNLWFTENTNSAIGRITSSGTITEFPLPTSHGNPVAITAGSDGNLWFTADFNIGRITPGGSITEFPTPYPASVQGITAGPDGNLWITETTPTFSGICRLTPTGTLTSFPVGTSSSRPAGITAGPDGNIWFADNGNGRIGRITPSGTITEFPVPSYATSPMGITTGPDGNLWFTNPNGDNISRITNMNKITEYPIS